MLFSVVRIQQTVHWYVTPILIGVVHGAGHEAGHEDGHEAGHGAGNGARLRSLLSRFHSFG